MFFNQPFNCAKTATFISSNSDCSINPSASSILAFLNLSNGGSCTVVTGADTDVDVTGVVTDCSGIAVIVANGSDAFTCGAGGGVDSSAMGDDEITWSYVGSLSEEGKEVDGGFWSGCCEIDGGCSGVIDG